MRGLLGNAWNAGTCCLRPFTSIDDVEFTRLIVSDMIANFRINTSRIFVSGFSNGAMMAEILSCECSDIFAASASVSGTVELLPGNKAGEAKCDSDYQQFDGRTSTLNIHGTLDPLVPWPGDPFLGFPPVLVDFADWATRNGCQGDPVSTWSKGPFSNQIFQNCSLGTTVELVKNIGGGHEWPMTKDFDTTDYVWQFLDAAPLHFYTPTTTTHV